MEDVDGTGVVAKGLNRYFAFLHPKQCHGVLSEVIDGKYCPYIKPFDSLKLLTARKEMQS